MIGCHNINKNQSGFTLIETVVAVAIAGILFVAAIGLFSSSIKGGKAALDIQKLTDELRNSVFDVEKQINESNGIDSAGCAACDELRIFNNSGKQELYTLDGSSRLKRKIDSNGDGTFDSVIDLTSNNIEILSLKFFIDNDISSQPRVAITVKAKPVDGRKTINIQNTISKKNY